MNLTLHIIRKDLRALRWPLLLWIVACLTHLTLRLVQHARGDAARLTPFWRGLESSNRWDHLALIVLPILIIPLLLHLDPVRGALSFWKSVPISRGRLLSAKSITLLAFFVALPFACEVVYFVNAGLSIVLATALADWAWRILPGIAAIVLGCAFTRSLKVGAPGVAIALAVAVWIFQWPFGRDRIANPLIGEVTRPRPGIVVPPDGARIEIEPKSVQFERTNYTENAIPGIGRRTEERLSIVLKLHVNALPENVLVSSVKLENGRIHLQGSVLAEVDRSASLQSTAGLFTLPVQEHREEFGTNEYFLRGLDANTWQASSGLFRVAAKDLPPNGVLVEGKVFVSLARRRVITTLPLEEGAQWRPGVHRFTLSQVSPEAKTASFRATLATVLADPRGNTGGLSLSPRTTFALWLRHRSLPYRKYLQPVSSAAWRATRGNVFGPTVSSRSPFNSGLGTETDITRSRKRTDFALSFDPIQAFRNDATPLAVARFAEEQAQVRNWQLAIVTYDDLGTIELPLKAVAPRPQLGREEEDRDELDPSRPSLAAALSEVIVPANPSRAEAQSIFARIAELAGSCTDDTIRRHEQVLLRKLAGLGAENLVVLLDAVAEVLRAPPADGNSPRHRSDWMLPWNDSPPFWRRVIIAACDMTRSADKAIVLRFHSPTVDLLRCIEPHGWEADALPGMCRIAANERVPASWQDCFARHPGPETKAALLAQIRQRAIRENRVAGLIASGVLPGREAAGELWETALANTGDIARLIPAFPLAVRHGVEIMPRDLVRILRLRREDFSYYPGVAPFKTWQSAFVQSFSLHSDCPPNVAEAATWLEQNALVLQFNDSTGRYELPGKTTPAPNLSAWGEFRDLIGAGHGRLEGGSLVLSSAGVFADYWNDVANRAAPRVMREIEGDFTAEVTVVPNFDLSPAWSRNPDQTFQSSGLVLDAGDQRWIRWEHGLWKTIDGHKLREEFFRSGKNSVSDRATDLWDPGKPVRLRLARHGDFFNTSWSQEGGPWVESPAFLELGWPRKVRVGLLVVNGVTRPLHTRFTDFTLTPTSPPPAKLASPLELHPHGDPTPTGTKLGNWGIVENPIGAGIFKIEENALSIDVAPKNADYNCQQRMTAPRVLNEIEGDFTFEATIAPTPRLNWSSAELLLAAEPEFYFRIGCAATTGNKSRLTYEYAERGRPSGVPPFDAQRDLTKPIRVRLQRRGWFLTVAHQQNGGEWTEFYPLNLRHWPGKIQAGFVVLNTSDEPFTGVFSDFKLVRDQPRPR